MEFEGRVIVNKLFTVLNIMPIFYFIVKIKYASIWGYIIAGVAIANLAVIIYHIVKKKSASKIFLIYLVVSWIAIFFIPAYYEPFSYKSKNDSKIISKSQATENDEVNEYLVTNAYGFLREIKKAK